MIDGQEQLSGNPEIGKDSKDHVDVRMTYSGKDVDDRTGQDPTG